MDNSDFFELVRRMRALQRDYENRRLPETLAAKWDLEFQVDAEIEKHQAGETFTPLNAL